MKYSIVKNELGFICRSCLNKKLGLDLTPADCHYAMYPARCNECEKMRNIVVNIRRAKRIAIRLKPDQRNKPSRLK